ncbi:hypothetical protein PMAYCL1PPCAC_15628 [Pristionchus mayeri]|uniref:G protein-coupled receptor n=1 Tax=Pristionchus mayeri TaxID=1317129 RepID=A0AAN5HYB2_9BILA|nr:hypothetical protein PMAYCL1PPCAC_15628 [Pristionchus mayeri]
MLIVSFRNHVVFQLASLFVISGSIFSQMAMDVERYRASKNVEKYERTNDVIGACLNAAHIIVLLLFCIIHCVFYGSAWTAIHCTFANPDEKTFNTTLVVGKIKLAILKIFL